MATEKTPDVIVKLIVDKLTQTVKRSGKKFSDKALAEWTRKLKTSVRQAQAEGSKWSLAEKNVLRVARDMGRIAVILAAKNPKITKAQVNGAFAACKDHAVCPSPAYGYAPGMGSCALLDFRYD